MSCSSAAFFMRFLKIFLLFLQMVFEQRSRVVIFFLESLMVPFTYFLFWRGAHFSQHNNWSFSSITSYYFLFSIINAAILCYPEFDIAHFDIQEGNLAAYLLRPFTYFGMRLINTLAHRLLELIMGIITLVIMISLYGKLFSFIDFLPLIILSIVIAVLGFLVTFTYKLILGVAGFWFIDTRGLFQISDMMMFIFTGAIVPIYFFPTFLQNIANFLPFPYMIYFPVLAFQGSLSFFQFFQIIVIQICWIIVLFFISQLLWKKGLKKFTAVGQ